MSKKYWKYKNWERHCRSRPRRAVQLKDAGAARHGILVSAHRFRRGVQMERWENTAVLVSQGLCFTQYRPSAKAAAAPERRAGQAHERHALLVVWAEHPGVCHCLCIARGYPAKRECGLSSADEGPGHWQAKGLVTGWFAPFSGWWHMESPSHLSLSPLSCLDLGQPCTSSVSAGGKSLCLGFRSASKLRQDAVGTSAPATPHAARKSAETNPLSKSALFKDFEKATVTWRRLVATTVHFS